MEAILRLIAESATSDRLKRSREGIPRRKCSRGCLQLCRGRKQKLCRVTWSLQNIAKRCFRRGRSVPRRVASRNEFHAVRAIFIALDDDYRAGQELQEKRRRNRDGENSIAVLSRS